MKRIYFVTQSQNSRRGTGEEEETYFIKKKLNTKNYSIPKKSIFGRL